MITKKFLRNLGLICLIPSFFGAMATIFLFTLDPIKISTFIEVVMILGGIGLMYYTMCWAFMVYGDNSFWMKKSEMDKTINIASEVKAKYERAIKKISKNILNTSIYTAQQINRINLFKSYFLNYFEGIPRENIDAICPMNVGSFGITNLDFDFKESLMVVTITLERPGILIGKAGTTIDGLIEYLNKGEKEKTEIKIIESNLWNYSKHTT